MRLSSFVIPLIIFVGLFIGIQNFGSEMLANSGVDASGLSSVEEQQKELEDKWGETASDDDPFTKEEGIIERAVGVTLIPRIIGDIFGVLTNFNEILTEIGQFKWIPPWLSTMLKSLVSAGIFFAIAAAYLRYRI